MKRFAVLVALLLCPQVARGDELIFKLQPLPPGPDKITGLKEGEQAPYEGRLFSKDTALRWGNYIDQCLDRWKVDVQRQQQLRFADMRALQEQSDLTRQTLQEALVNERTARVVAEQALINPPFYRSVWFGVAAGVGVTALAGLGVALLSK